MQEQTLKLIKEELHSLVVKIEDLDKEIAGMQRNIDNLENTLCDLTESQGGIIGQDIKRALHDNHIIGR
jgi:chromosome segregation ATPase